MGPTTPSESVDNSNPRNAMEALDEGISEGHNYGTGTPADEDDRKMPPGFAQVDSDLTPAQIRKIRANMYFFHGFVGILLLPFALILRAGRWSMRTLVCHHNGDEFGGW